MTTYPLATLSAQVSATGIAAPSYDDIYLSLVASYQSIYGTDVVLTADTQDGQWIGIIAQAVTDVNAGAVAVYNSFSPASAVGTGLSSVVKINGLAREATSFSTCPVAITGTAGTIITNGTVKDAVNTWSLPPTVTIPPESSITVTATCQAAGAVTAEIGTITKIGTPTLGWLTVTNSVAAAPGAPGESDAKLRARQAVSTGIPAKTPIEAITGQILNLPGVTRVNYDENTTPATNANGTPGHSFTMVVEGGDAATIARTIANGKLGAGTRGSVSEIVIDQYGVPSTVSFDTPTYERIIVNVSIKPLAGYTVTIGNAVVSGIAAYINGLAIGESIYLTQVIAAAIQNSGGIGTFNLTALAMCIFGGSPSAADIAIAFNQAATCSTADVTLSLVS